MSTDHDDILAHLAQCFGPVEPLALQEILPVSGIAIHAIRPRDDDDPLVLFTTGMSDRAQSVPEGQEPFRYTELMVQLPGDWPLDEPARFWPLEWLKKLAWYPHANQTWLGGPFTIVSNGEPPEPLGDDTALSCLLLLCESDELSPIRCASGKEIQLYSMVPLYTEERDLERDEGLGALLERFEANELSLVVDPDRVNVADDE